MVIITISQHTQHWANAKPHATCSRCGQYAPLALSTGLSTPILRFCMAHWTNYLLLGAMARFDKEQVQEWIRFVLVASEQEVAVALVAVPRVVVESVDTVLIEDWERIERQAGSEQSEVAA